MDRKLREGAERIRWIEGFDVMVSRPAQPAYPFPHSGYLKYEETRAASRKWNVDYWIRKRFSHFGLNVRVLYPDGSEVSSQTPLSVPREAFRLEKWYEKPPFGSSVALLWQPPTSEAAMALRSELGKFGINAQYKLEKFLLMRSHLLRWTSPPVHMMTFEWRSFLHRMKGVSSALDSHFEWQVCSRDAKFLDQTGYSYAYFDGSEVEGRSR